MKYWHTTIVLVTLLFVAILQLGSVQAEGEAILQPKSDPETKAVVVVVVGAQDVELQKQVADHISRESAWPTRLLNARLALTGSPEEQAQAISAQIRASDLCAVAFLNVPNSNVSFRSGVFPAARVGLVDVGWLRREADGNAVRPETLRLRVLKESMRSFGQLLGMKDCPYPRCCMFLCETLNQLDSKGTDFCPPCQVKAEAILQKIGDSTVSE